MKLRYKILIGFTGFILVAIIAIVLILSHTSECQPIAAPAPGTETMKAIVYNCYGPPEVLELVDVALPQPEDHQMLVKVQAAGVNPLDWHNMRGAPYIMRLGGGLGAPEESRLGVDFAGTIVAVGKDITRYKVGDEVFGGRTGAFGEYVVVSEESSIVPKPDSISFEEAASVPVAALTALQALRDNGNLQRGQSVLINGASGGVGTFAVQIAKSMGAEVTGVCSTRNQEMVKSIGADHMFDYKKEDYTLSGNQYDLIVDMVGNHSISKNLDVLKPGGSFVIVGGAKGDWIGPLVNPIKSLIMDNFVDEHLMFFVAQFNQDDLSYLADLLQSGEMTPVIEKTFTLDQVPDAIAHSESGRTRGKLVVTMAE